MPPLLCERCAGISGTPSLMGSSLLPSTGSSTCQEWVVGPDVSLQDPRDFRGPVTAIGRDGGLTCGQGGGVQVSVSIPSPHSSLALADLEPELRDSIVAKHGDKMLYVYFNKGL